MGILGATLGILGAMLGILGAMLGILGSSWAVLGAILGGLGLNLKLLGGWVRELGVNLEASWRAGWGIFGLVLVIMMLKVSNTTYTAKLPNTIGKHCFCGFVVGLWAFG